VEPTATLEASPEPTPAPPPPACEALFPGNVLPELPLESFDEAALRLVASPDWRGADKLMAEDEQAVQWLDRRLLACSESNGQGSRLTFTRCRGTRCSQPRVWHS
jgi:hypothetical protein